MLLGATLSQTDQTSATPKVVVLIILKITPRQHFCLL